MFNPFRKIMHRNEDYDDLRSHIVGERFDDFSQAPAPAAPMQQPAPQFDDFTPKTRSVFDFPQQQDVRPDLRPDTDFSGADRAAEKKSRDYEILDRLDMIESQIAVVRSQTETINERLKNLEAKLGTRRY